MPDVLGPFLTFFLDKAKNSTIALWWRLLFEMAFSAVTTFLITCGVSLQIGTRASLAIGNGMVAAAVVLTYLFRKESNRLTKGMLVVLPAIEANKELNTDLQTIQKS